VISLGLITGCFGAVGLRPRADWFARVGRLTSGCIKLSTAAWMSLVGAQSCALNAPQS